jgi:hypothetical protein
MTIPLQRQRHHRTDDAGAQHGHAVAAVHRALIVATPGGAAC